MNPEANPVDETATAALYWAIGSRNWAEARRILDEIRDDLDGRSLPFSSNGTRLFANALLRAGPHIPVDLLRDLVGIADRRVFMENLSELVEGRCYLLNACVQIVNYNIDRLQIIAEAYPAAVEADTNIQGLTSIDSLCHPEVEDAAAKISMLLRVCPEAAFKVNSDRFTILHRAIILKTGDTEALRAMIDSRPDLVFQEDKNGNAPIHLAVLVRHLEACKFLLDFMGPQRALDLRCALGTALHVAVRFESCDERIARLFVEKVPGLLAAPDDHGFSPIDTVRLQSMHLHELSKQVVKRLVDHDPQLLQIVDDEDRDPLALLRAQQELFPNTQDTGFVIAVLTRIGKVARVLIEGIGPSRSLHDLLGDPSFPMDLGGAIVCAAGAEELQVQDANGDLPIHILAGRAASLDNHVRYNLAVKVMLHLFPESAHTANTAGKLPLELMADSKHCLDHGMMLLIEAHPAAIRKIIRSRNVMPSLCDRLQIDTLYRMWTGAPELARMLCEDDEDDQTIPQTSSTQLN